MCYNVRMNKRIVVFLCVCASAFFQLSAAFSPSVTVTFANFQNITAAVQSIAEGTQDKIILSTVPSGIRNQPLVKLFGPMRPGANGAAVCYVDADAIARILSAKPDKSMNAQKRRDIAIERAKHWTVLYPATFSRSDLLRIRPDATIQKGGVIKIPAGQGLDRPMFALYSADGKWVAFAGVANLAVHTFTSAKNAIRFPLGRNLVYMQMDAAGMRALFQSNDYAGGSVSVKMSATGLEVNGVIRRTHSEPLAALNPRLLSFAGIPSAASLYGITSAKNGSATAGDVFAFFGPEFAAFVKSALIFRQAGGGASNYYLNLALRGAKSAGAPQARFLRILPEARKCPGLNNAMFCSIANVMRLCIPRIVQSLPPGAGLKMSLAIPMLRNVRGDGAGFMSWRENGHDRFFMRISKDELRGTARLWSLVLFS